MSGGSDLVTGTSEPGEKTTKERIFEVAIDLFAQKGFDAVSMREIAEAVGIKKASLYSHFSGKEEILGQIIDYPTNRLAGPEGGDIEELIVSMGAEGFMRMADGVFTRWIETPGMEKVWRILCIELYHNERIKAFYEKFTADAISFWRSNFEIMAKHGHIKRCDPDLLAMEYMAFYQYTFMDYFIFRYGNRPGSFIEVEGERLGDHLAFLIRSIKK